MDFEKLVTLRARLHPLYTYLRILTAVYAVAKEIHDPCVTDEQSEALENLQQEMAMTRQLILAKNDSVRSFVKRMSDIANIRAQYRQAATALLTDMDRHRDVLTSQFTGITLAEIRVSLDS